MNPSDIYSNTLFGLTDARTAMLSLDWHTALATAPLQQRADASQQLIQTEQAILALSIASLNDIASKLQANEAGLTAATKSLEKDLQDITKVQNILNDLATVLNVVSQIVSFL